MYGRQEVSCKLVVAGGDCAEVFECVEESLDQIAFAVEGEIAVSLNEAVDLGRDDRVDASRFQGQDQPVRIIGFVREKGLRGEVFQQRFSLAQIRDLPLGQGEGDWIAQSIDESVNFGRQPASGSSDRLVLAAFFGAPALCW